MNIQFKPANPATDSVALSELDQRMFSEADYFRPEHWLGYSEVYWIIVDDQIAGSIAFDPNIEPMLDRNFVTNPGCLLIVSTGLLPEFRGHGIGEFTKRWEIDYARAHGYSRLFATCRPSNTPIIRLNEKLGFVKTGEIPGFFHDPDEPAIKFELRL